ncbi:MAG: hypothetical protein FJY88_08185, partial [Candidatus Eisenbacteria bacterium]|nr:hypothetical protein [Candidatus Eisenbacteria bacterium]
MRLASVLFSLLLFGLLAGVALADPNAPAEEKEWQLYVDPTRAIIPEVEPNNTCPGQTVACGDVVDPATIATSTDVDWYTVYNVIGGTILTFATDNGSNCGAPYLTDSYIELYYNCGTTRVAYDDDSGPGYYSLLTYTVPAGSPGNYSLKVRGYSASYTGCYKLSITCAGPPPNDRCDGAFPWQRCSSGTVNGTTVGAVNDYSPQPPSPGCTGYPATGGDVTYRLDLQRGDVVTVTYTTPNHDGSIYMVTDCANPGATCVIGDDDPEPETWTYTALTAGTYYVIADGYSASGPFTLDWSITCPSPGACCNLATGACYYILQTDCVPPMEWYGGPCGPNNEPCPQPPPLGACCFEDGHCELLTQAQCDAAPGHIAWLGQGTVCEPVNPCPQPGACCDLATGACYFVLEQFCAPPLVWFGGPC